MSIYDLNEGIPGSLFGGVVSLRNRLAQRRRVARDWATLEQLDDRMISDLGLWRERESRRQRRGGIRF